VRARLRSRMPLRRPRFLAQFRELRVGQHLLPDAVSLEVSTPSRTMSPVAVSIVSPASVRQIRRSVREN
jgi:hypothetical protein